MTIDDDWQKEIFQNVCGILEDAARATEDLQFDELHWVVLKLAAQQVTTTLLLDAPMKQGPLKPSQIEVYLAAVERQKRLFDYLGVENPYQPAARQWQ
jgi:hypothetical protein